LRQYQFVARAITPGWAEAQVNVIDGDEGVSANGRLIELHILRARLNGGIFNKAARGELRLWLPVGLVWG